MEKVRRTIIFFEKDNNTFSTFKERNKQKGNILKIMRLPRQRSRSLAKIISFEKDNTTHRRTVCFLVREKMKKQQQRNYYQKMPTV